LDIYNGRITSILTWTTALTFWRRSISNAVLYCIALYCRPLLSSQEIQNPKGTVWSGYVCRSDCVQA